MLSATPGWNDFVFNDADLTIGKNQLLFVMLSAAKNPLGFAHRGKTFVSPAGFFAALRMTNEWGVRLLEAKML